MHPGLWLRLFACGRAIRPGLWLRSFASRLLRSFECFRCLLQHVMHHVVDVRNRCERRFSALRLGLLVRCDWLQKLQLYVRW